MDKDLKSKIDDFLEITNDNLDTLYLFLVSAHQSIRMSSTEAGYYIKEKYGNDFYYVRENKRHEDYLKSVQEKCAKLGRSPTGFDY